MKRVSAILPAMPARRGATIAWWGRWPISEIAFPTRRWEMFSRAMVDLVAECIASQIFCFHAARPELFSMGDLPSFSNSSVLIGSIVCILKRRLANNVHRSHPSSALSSIGLETPIFTMQRR